MKELVESPRPVSHPTDDTSAGGKMRLTRQLLTPYRGWIAIILLAMLVETAMALAAPWPLKVILDNVVGTHKAPEWLDAVRSSFLGENKMALAAVAGIATVLIAALGAVASYIDNYYTESVGQWVAHDLRMRVYDHLQHLSLGFYDTHQTGALLSTITDDIKTIQNFASSSTLDIFVDLLTIIGMLGVMLWLEFDFALIAVGVSPFLLLFVARLNRAVKRATHEVRHHQSDIVAVVEQGLESIRVVKAFGRQELEESRLKDVSQATVEAALKARRVKSLLSPAVTLVVAVCTGFVLTE
jgi:ABC-type multidrug transport system fused ATPase/permease subunit